MMYITILLALFLSLATSSPSPNPNLYRECMEEIQRTYAELKIPPDSKDVDRQAIINEVMDRINPDKCAQVQFKFQFRNGTMTIRRPNQLDNVGHRDGLPARHHSRIHARTHPAESRPNRINNRRPVHRNFVIKHKLNGVHNPNFNRNNVHQLINQPSPPNDQHDRPNLYGEDPGGTVYERNDVKNFQGEEILQPPSGSSVYNNMQGEDILQPPTGDTVYERSNVNNLQGEDVLQPPSDDTVYGRSDVNNLQGEDILQPPTGSSVYNNLQGEDILQPPSGSSAYNNMQGEDILQPPSGSSAYNNMQGEDILQPPTGDTVYERSKVNNLQGEDVLQPPSDDTVYGRSDVNNLQGEDILQPPTGSSVYNNLQGEDILQPPTGDTVHGRNDVNNLQGEDVVQPPTGSPVYGRNVINNLNAGKIPQPLNNQGSTESDEIINYGIYHDHYEADENEQGDPSIHQTIENISSTDNGDYINRRHKDYGNINQSSNYPQQVLPNEFGDYDDIHNNNNPDEINNDQTTQNDIYNLQNQPDISSHEKNNEDQSEEYFKEMSDKNENEKDVSRQDHSVNNEKNEQEEFTVKKIENKSDNTEDYNNTNDQVNKIGQNVLTQHEIINEENKNNDFTVDYQQQYQFSEDTSYNEMHNNNLHNSLNNDHIINSQQSDEKVSSIQGESNDADELPSNVPDTNEEIIIHKGEDIEDINKDNNGFQNKVEYDIKKENFDVISAFTATNNGSQEGLDKFRNQNSSKMPLQNIYDTTSDQAALSYNETEYNENKSDLDNIDNSDVNDKFNNNAPTVIKDVEQTANPKDEVTITVASSHSSQQNDKFNSSDKIGQNYNTIKDNDDNNLYEDDENILVKICKLLDDWIISIVNFHLQLANQMLKPFKQINKHKDNSIS